MDERSKAALELLVQGGYLEPVKGKYRCTAKLNDEVAGKAPRLTQEDWEARYISFIEQCNIPRKGESGDGTMYNLNQYTADGMKRFRQMLEKEQVNLDLLIMVTKAYYTGSIRYKKKIGNYITENLWRMDYESLKNVDQKQQAQTLQKQMNDTETFTRDRIG